MYVYISAIAQLHSPGSPWAVVDLSAATLSQIDTTYSDVYLRVSSPFWTEDHTMRFREITHGYLERNHTLQQYFDAKANTTLPSTVGVASIKEGHVKYADAFWAGYQLERANYLSTTGPTPPPDYADTLVMSKPGVDGRVFHKNCLVSINGLIHRVDADSEKVYVLEAGTSNYISRRNEVGIINFSDVAELECITITPEMLFRMHEDQPFANQVFIQAPNDSKNKTAALVMGGYLFLLDNLTFFRTGENIFCLDTQSIALLDRFYESRKLMDMSSLGLDYNGAHKAQISREQLFSDAVITKWLTMSQSFLVFIDCPNIDVTRTQLATTHIAKQYLAYEQPTLPIVGGFGLIEPYWVQEDDNVFSITIGDNIRPHHLYHTTPAEQSPMPADNKIPYDKESYTRVHFLDIQSEKVVITPKAVIITNP